ncbi:MAG: signal peptidase I [Lentisphaeria bacterium]
MSIVGIIILDAILFWFLFGNMCMKYLRTKKSSVKHQLKEYEKYFSRRLCRNRDIMSDKEVADLNAAIEELQQAQKEQDLKKTQACLRAYENGKAECVLQPKKSKWFADQFEILVVALGVAFGLRALFIQPFKIPTGSMQPTLYGIHFIQEEEPYSKNKLKRFFSYLNYSKRYVDIVLEWDANPSGLNALPSKPFFPQSELSFEGAKYVVPAAPVDVYKAINSVYSKQMNHKMNFKRGDVFLRGAFELGDHLFVNRLALCFREPRRGDVMVFVTDNLEDPDGQGFGGRYYIKRLVGLPGDELLIRDRKLYVKEPGASEFRLLDKSDDPGFERMYSFKGGYHGYSHMAGSLHLRNNKDSFKIPAGHYFMLGDNSENSKDSRYWGTVPRNNLVGIAGFVWWPFTRRWGRVNKAEPVQVDTPPNLPVIEG